MPTLTNFPPDSDRGTPDSGNDDGSVTILHDDNSAIIDPPMELSPVHWHQNDKSVTFDGSTILCSTVKLDRICSVRRRESLNSDVSLSLSDDGCSGTKLEESIGGDSQMNPKAQISSNQSPHLNVCKRQRDTRELSRTNRYEYHTKYQDFVKRSISKFVLKNPGVLRDYRNMSLEEKAREQQRILALLKRLGISKSENKVCRLLNTDNEEENDTQLEKDKKVSVDLKASRSSDRQKLLNETLLPAFPLDKLEEESTRSLCGDATLDNTSNLDSSIQKGERSELLVSMDASDMEQEKAVTSDGLVALPSVDYERNDLAESVEFPVDNYPNDESSMELVRREQREYVYSEEDEASHGTPENQIRSRSGHKRRASVSGKRGSDLQRVRQNDYGVNVDKDISNCFGRLSLSPLANSSQQNLFAASQSPISPRLAYHIPNHRPKDEDGSEDGAGGQRISWGSDIGYRGMPTDDTKDSVATNTPPRRYPGEAEKCRAFREVLMNVSLKDGATFHIQKLAVKRTEHAVSRSTDIAKAHNVVARSRRLVSFPDPFVHYGSRQRRALKELYSWIRRAESEYEKGHCNVPAVGLFFSLSEQQTIDLSLRLFLRDLDGNYQHESSKYVKGNTLVVLRSKEETLRWEYALREKTGCSVSNHSLLPLSDRIRLSTVEKLRAHEVVLTTYDAIKSPDVTIPISKEGYAVLTKIGSDKSWHSTSRSQDDSCTKVTKKLSILHRVHFRRIIFIDTLGRKCFLAKRGTARAHAAVALNGDTRIVLFRESECDGSDPMKTLQKCDKRAFQSVCSVLRLPQDHEVESSYYDEEDGNSITHNPLEAIAMNLKDLC